MKSRLESIIYFLWIFPWQTLDKGSVRDRSMEKRKPAAVVCRRIVEFFREFADVSGKPDCAR